MTDNIIAKPYNIELDMKTVKPLRDKTMIMQVGDSVVFNITLIQDGVPKNLTNCSVDFMVVRNTSQTSIEQKYNDGIKIINPLEGTIKIILKPDIVEIADTMLGGLVIYDADEIIFSNSFYFSVIDNIFGDKIKEAQDNIETLIKLDRLMDEYKNKLVTIDEKVTDLENRLSELGQGGTGHIHNNMTTLNKLTEANGKLQYNGLEVGGNGDVTTDYLNTNYYNKTVTDNKLISKVEKVEGKGLSTNDFDDNFKTKLEGLQNYTHPNNINTRHVTDAQINIWNSKSDEGHTHTEYASKSSEHTHSNKIELDKIVVGDKAKIDSAYTHSTSSHAPSTAQKNSDITKTEIEAKLVGDISSHIHSQYSLNTHGHSGAYEPANINIQQHISSTHAPSNAQRNADITKAEIEAT